MKGNNLLRGTVIDLGKVSADVNKNKDGSYRVHLMDNKGSRPDLCRIDVGNRPMLMEVLSWFTEK